MARMVVVYKTPEDIKAFNRHYFEKHVPIAKKRPGLRKYEVSEAADGLEAVARVRSGKFDLVILDGPPVLGRRPITAWLV